MSSVAVSGLVIQRTSTADQVATALRHRILAGQIRPGTALREVALASTLGVSRNTLREALRILIPEGLVRHTVHHGITVTQLTEEDVVEIYNVRRLLELRAVQGARLDAKRLSTIAQVVDRLDAAAKERDWAALVEHDMLFHRLLVGLLGSARLEAFYANLLAELRLLLVATDRASHNLSRLTHEHRRVLRLLAAGKKAECARFLERHLDEAERLVRASLAQVGPTPRA